MKGSNNQQSHPIGKDIFFTLHQAVDQDAMQ